MRHVRTKVVWCPEPIIFRRKFALQRWDLEQTPKFDQGKPWAKEMPLAGFTLLAGCRAGHAFNPRIQVPIERTEIRLDLPGAQAGIIGAARVWLNGKGQ